MMEKIFETQCPFVEASSEIRPSQSILIFEGDEDDDED